MSYVATLIANPNNPVLDQQIGEQAAESIGASQLYWLADGIACDIPLPSNTNCDQARQQISAVIANAPIDLTIQVIETRRKKALIADMDSTMIDQECIDELAIFAGVYEKVAAITIRTMNGELNFDTSMRERVAMLAGLNVAIINQVIEEKITLASGGKTLVQTMRNNGAYTALVSGGFTSFTAKVAEQIGFHENRANILIEENGVLAGKVVEPILGADSKVVALNDIAKTHDLTATDFIAVGDGANDLPMLKSAGTGVALHAKPTVAAASKHRINHGDLTALLYMQGYRQSDFVT
ncbi:MAG: phosphoserine phosphatase SerB [Rhizobiaceae bacterium]